MRPDLKFSWLLGVARLRRCQSPPQQIQVGERKQSEPVRKILGQAPIAHLGMSPQVLDHTEGVLAPRSHPRAALVNGFLMRAQWLTRRGPAIHPIAHTSLFGTLSMVFAPISTVAI